MYLKYILKNIKSFFRENFIIFILLILSALTSSVIIFFAYGIYQNYNAILSYQDAEGYNDYIYVEYKNTASESVTKQDLLNCLNEIDGISNELQETITLYTVVGAIDDAAYEFKFLYNDGSFKTADIFADNLIKYGNLTDGMYWTDYEEANAICVALIPDTDVYGEVTALSSIMSGGKLLIGGKEYEIIGKHSWNEYGAMIPFSTVSNECILERTMINFDTSVSTKTYNMIRNIFNIYMGDKAVFAEINTIDKDAYYTYKTVILISVFIALIAAVNFMILYRYIISTRNKTTAIFKILGLTSRKLNFMNMSECMILILPFFILGMIIYQYIFLPRLGRYFIYMEEAYSPSIYILLFLIFMFISFVVIGIMLFSMTRKRILDLIKDRG